MLLVAVLVVGWDLHAALKSHKAHKSNVKMKEIVDVGKMDEKYSDINGKSYYEAQVFCRDRNQRLCTLREYCPDDTLKFPKAGLVDGDVWVPISDAVNEWIQVRLLITPNNNVKVRTQLGRP